MGKIFSDNSKRRLCCTGNYLSNSIPELYYRNTAFRSKFNRMAGKRQNLSLIHI